MRTTVTLDDDVAAAVEQLRRQGFGVSAAVNQLVRRGLGGKPPRRPFEQRTSAGHARIDVTDVAETTELLEGPAAS